MTTKTVSEKALDKASDLVERAADTAVDIFAASKHIIGDAIEKYGQQAIDAVLWVVRIDCAQTIFTNIILFIICVGALYYIFTGLTKRNWMHYVHNSDGGFLVLIIPVVLVACVGGYHTLKELTNVWNYVCVAKPELYLVKQTIDVVKNKATE